MPRLVNFMYKGLKNAMSLVLYMRDFYTTIYRYYQSNFLSSLILYLSAIV